MSRLLLGAVTIALGVALAPYIVPILGWGLVLVVVLAVAGGVLWYGLRVLATAVALVIYPFYQLSVWADGLRSWWAREFMRTLIVAGLAAVGWSALIGAGWLGDYLACSPGWAHKPRCWNKYTTGSEYGPGGRRWDAAKWYAEGWRR